MKPNHHWAIHIFDQIHDYGSVYNFWAFLGERLNGVLKNMNTSGWSGGMLEISMLREFERQVKMDRLVCNLILIHKCSNLSQFKLDQCNEK
jgi:hypothetical protein